MPRLQSSSAVQSIFRTRSTGFRRRSPFHVDADSWTERADAANIHRTFWPRDYFTVRRHRHFAQLHRQPRAFLRLYIVLHRKPRFAEPGRGDFSMPHETNTPRARHFMPADAAPRQCIEGRRHEILRVIGQVNAHGLLIFISSLGHDGDTATACLLRESRQRSPIYHAPRNTIVTLSHDTGERRQLRWPICLAAIALPRRTASRAVLPGRISAYRQQGKSSLVATTQAHGTDFVAHSEAWLSPSRRHVIFMLRYRPAIAIPRHYLPLDFDGRECSMSLKDISY